VPKSKIENLQNHKTILENQNSHIPYIYSQVSCTFTARNRDYPVVYAHEVHAREMHAYEMHAYEVYAHKMYAREVHAYEMYACEMYAL
jgi:hypothetical protein